MGLERKRRRRETGTGWGKGFTYASLADGLDMGGGCVGNRRLVSPTLRPAQGLFKRVQALSSPLKRSQALDHFPEYTGRLLLPCRCPGVVVGRRREHESTEEAFLSLVQQRSQITEPSLVDSTWCCAGSGFQHTFPTTARPAAEAAAGGVAACAEDAA